MEKKIVITSNGCLNKYENTLCSFRNEIPKQHLPTHKRWKLGIESIGIFCEFLNEAVSKNNTHPALLFFSKGYLIEMLGNDILASDQNKDVSSRQSLNLDMFHPSQRYYLNKNKDYDLKTLNSLFTEQTLLYYNHKKNFIIKHQNTYDPKFIGFPTSFDESTGYLEFGQFGFSYLDEKLRAYLLFHETFYHHLEGEQKKSSLTFLSLEAIS